MMDPGSTESSDVVSLESLVASVTAYFPEADVGLITKAHDFSIALHEGQRRKSGEPYIIHPLAVSRILAEMRLDIATIATGLLHDTVEDTATSLDIVEREFGLEIAQLVDGVTKISKIEFRSSHEKQAENFRKMVLAMAKDIRVILVKLADRTHNMRTLQHLASHKQQVIAQETLDIYAPLANRLGISWMKIELEDLSLKYLKPEIYQKLSKLIAKKKTERGDYIETVIRILKEKTAEYGLKVEVTGRPKHFYSIYKKMESRKINFEEINDLVAFRIVTASIAECYEALGIVHMFFKPVPGRFKDYIAMPKNNMYQSLHTTVMGPFGERLEIQIRTLDMHRIADSGIAAHWEYKDGKLSERDSIKFHWLRQLVEAQEQVKDPTEFLESVKLDLFAGDIYVFTPKGELKELPAGSTPLDFAYSIHTQLGNTCSGAKVNGRMVSLKHKLRSGDAVDIITNPGQKPSKDWLKIVRTSRAKAKIRQYIKTEERDRSRQMGYELLDRQFRRFGHSLAKWEKLKDLGEQVSALSFATFDEMLISIGYGKITADKLVEKIFPDSEVAAAEESPKPGAWMSDVLETAKEKLRSTATGKAVRLGGLDDILVRFGKCCNPIPGDEITGFISRGRGVTVHKLGCPRVLDLDEDRRVEVHWASDLTKLTTSAKLKITVQDEPGLLNEMSRVISSTGVNIKGLNIRVGKDQKATGIFDLEVNHKDQLARCIRDLEALPGVITVERVVKSP